MSTGRWFVTMPGLSAGERAVAPIRAWLIERAMEHERPSLLFSELCAELRRQGIERPAVAEAMRLVAWARERAHELTFAHLTPQLLTRSARSSTSSWSRKAASLDMPGFDHGRPP